MDWNAIGQFILQLINGLISSKSAQNQTPVTSSTNTIYIKRGPLESAGIFGNGSLTWDLFKFVSLENTKLYIPAGTYKLVWHVSPHLNNATVPMLVDVLGRTEILIHWGNDEACSEGCILCGLSRDGNDIDTTQTACQELYAKIRAVGIENCQITIS